MMLDKEHPITLPAIPAKRYFTIGEVSDLCGVKAHVLRYWEQEFSQLNTVKRRGNRRYYQRHEVILIRRIRELLYEQGFTISGARNQLAESAYLLNEAKEGASCTLSQPIVKQDIRSELSAILALLEPSQNEC